MKKFGILVKSMCIIAMAIFTFSFTADTVQAGAMGTTWRPISDFIEAQGTNSQYFPPVPDYYGNGDNPFTLFALVDYAGLADQYLKDTCPAMSVGTTLTGSVRERVLKNGKVEVRVKLYADNAMGFAQLAEDLDANGWNFAATDTIFGNKTVDVCDGAVATVGWTELDVSFTVEESGAPLPDICDDDVLGDTSYWPVKYSLKAQIFDGDSFVKVFEKAEANEGDEELTWVKEVVEIKQTDY